MTNQSYRVSISDPSSFRENVTPWLIEQMKTNASGPIAQGLRGLNWCGTLQTVSAYLGWASMVRGGAPWDFKPDIAEVALQMSDPDDPDRRTPVVRIGGRVYRHDIVANIHYGYVGRASGFPIVDLLAFAGAAQITAGTSDWSYWYTLFDDPADAAAIRVGMELWDTYELSFTEEDLAMLIKKHARHLPEVFPGARLAESSSQ